MPRPQTLYFDCASGASGDMTVAALLDLGLDQDEFLRRLDSLGLEGYRVEIGRRTSAGMDSCAFEVIPTREERTHRHLSDIRSIIEASDLPAEVKELSLRIFVRLAEAEATVHGTTIEEIHFHEVGAVDSIVDIVSASICLTMIGADRVVASPIALGSGYTTCAHGTIPVPVPATVELLKGVPVRQTGIAGELVTPTGAAVISTVAGEFGTLPAMTLEASGTGSGKKELERPNVLRVFLGTEAGGRRNEELTVLETNIDDMQPELYSHLVPLLLERGALDAYLTNVLMKKGRPGVLVTVLCKPEDEAALEDLIFAETTTLGVRRRRIERSCVDRRGSDAETRFGPVRVKEILRNGRVVRRACEYEECRRIAAERNLPLRDVYIQVELDIRPEA